MAWQRAVGRSLVISRKMIKRRAFLTTLALAAGAKAAEIRPAGGKINRARINYDSVGFSPDTISGLKLWLKADALVLSDNDAVASWTDSSGLGNHAVQATEAAKPTYKTAIQNGKPVVRFDGTDDFMACPAITAASGMTCFCVGKVTLATNFGMFFVVNAALFELRQNGVAGTAQLFSGTGTVNGADALGWHAYSFATNGSNLSQLWTDGASNGTRAEGQACGTPVIGARLAASLPMNGDIAECLLYDSLLSDSNRQLVEAYLKAKYATP